MKGINIMKILINGRNTVLTADIIRHTSDDCICASTSDLWADILVHIKFMQPDAYIVFYDKEDEKEQTMINQMRKISNDGICKDLAYVIIGDPAELEDLGKRMPYLEALKINRPTSAGEIEKRTKAYIEALARKRQEEEEKLKEMEAAARARREERKALEEQKKKKKEEEKMLDDLLSGKLKNPPAAESKPEPSPAPELFKPRAPKPETADAPKTTESTGGARKHILIVDDDRNVLKLLKTTLSEKYEVTPMLNGKMAEKYLETKTADLILLDHEMPVESGLEVFQKIKAQKSQENIPVVFLTGTTDTEKIKEILALHPKGYLLKPVDVDKLMTTIENAIS